MLTYTITGPKPEVERAASKLRTTHQVEGKIVAMFPQGKPEDVNLNPAINVIIICRPED